MHTTTIPRPTRPEFLDGFAAIHEAMRRDAARLPEAIAAVRSTAEAAPLARWYAAFRSTIEHHHRREDDVVWPELLRRAPDFAEAEAGLLEDHHDLDRALVAVSAALADLDGGAASTAAALEAAAALRDLLTAHLEREEAAAFPRLAATYTVEEYEALEEQLRRGTSITALAFEVPWVLDGMDPEKVAALIADAPLVLRVLHRLIFVPRYRKVAAPILAVAR